VKRAPLCFPVAPMRLAICVLFALAITAQSPYAGSVPLRLAFLPTASTVPDGAIQFEDVHRFDGAIAPVGEENLFRNALGMTDPGATSLSATYGFFSRTQGGIFWESRLQTAGLEVKQVLLKWGEDAPLSVAAAVNAQTRFAPADADRFSTGGTAILQRTGKTWTALATFAGQTGTLADTGEASDLAFAWSAGLLRRGEYCNVFGEAVFPLQGHRTYAGRAPDGIPLFALGIGFPLWRGTLDVLVLNATSISPGNLLSGPNPPAPLRKTEAHLGVAYRYGFDLKKNSTGEKAPRPPAPQ
jgi:hypothetical protein